LDVHCFGLHAGTLTDRPPAMRFGYADSWVQAGRPSLSQSLPLDGGFGAEAVAAFFGGLLPEGRPRVVLARQLGVSERNDFALLAAIGGDTAGAVSLVEPGAAPPATTGTDVDWLDDAGLAAVPTRLRARFASDGVPGGAGLGVGVSRRRLRAMARRAPEAAALVRAEFAGSGWDRELLGEIVEVVERRAGWLERMAE
jgi:HipA-like protein